MGIRKAAAGLVIAAVCGGSAMAVGGCGATGVVDPVAQAATVSTGTPGYRMKLAMQIRSPALPGPINATGAGSFDTRDHSGSFTMAMDFSSIPQVASVLGGQTLRLEELISGLTVYMKLPAALTAKLPGVSTPWLKLDLTKLAAKAGVPGLSALSSTPLSSDPSQVLQYLRAVSGGVTDEGPARVNGVRTTQYAATVDLARVPDALPSASRGAAQQAVGAIERMSGLQKLPIEAWIDRHHLVRRMRLGFSENTAGQTMSVLMTLDFTHYGPQRPPTLPPADQVTDLGALLGAAG